MRVSAVLALRLLLWSLAHLGFVFLHLSFCIRKGETHSYPAVN